MQARIKKIIEILNREYPNPKPFLEFNTPFQLLVATILSAQCSDERVNKITKILFERAGTPKKILALGHSKLLQIIRPTGFFQTKTKHILASSKMLIEKYDGRIPDNLDLLQELPGVGRKTASVVLSQAFGIPAFPVDRHVHRVALRLGITRAKTAIKADITLRKTINKALWISTHLQMISHGRKICKPKPKCTICPLLAHCPYGKRMQKSQ